MNVLVTGGSGFLGKHVCREFVEAGYKVYSASRSLCNEEWQSYSVDITDFHALSSLVGEKSISTIVHLAGKPIVSDCDNSPFDAFRINGLGTASVLEAARVNKVRRVVSIETDKVYGFQTEVPTKENAVPNPNSPYELSKVLSTNFAEFYRKQYDMKVVSVRPANLFGPGDFSMSRLIPRALYNLKRGEGIRIYESALEMKRDFVYVKDAASAIHKLATQSPKHNIYNISANDPMSIADVADRITSSLRINLPHTIVPKDGNFPEIPLQEIDGSRIMDEFGFTYTKFENAIQETWKELV